MVTNLILVLRTRIVRILVPLRKHILIKTNILRIISIVNLGILRKLITIGTLLILDKSRILIILTIVRFNLKKLDRIIMNIAKNLVIISIGFISGILNLRFRIIIFTSKNKPKNLDRLFFYKDVLLLFHTSQMA